MGTIPASSSPSSSYSGAISSSATVAAGRSRAFLRGGGYNAVVLMDGSCNNYFYVAGRASTGRLGSPRKGTAARRSRRSWSAVAMALRSPFFMCLWRSTSPRSDSYFASFPRDTNALNHPKITACYPRRSPRGRCRSPMPRP